MPLDKKFINDVIEQKTNEISIVKSKIRQLQSEIRKYQKELQTKEASLATWYEVKDLTDKTP